jgi:hypothetical protein
LLREWLRVCDREHRGCHSRDNGVLPTRVLDVGDNSLRLYCTKQDEREDYIALSHCWGQLSLEKRERSCTYLRNIDTRRERIDIDELPKTFQDAIRVTRQLDKRYLWIDSLCIIQDDANDWESESKIMETVFNMAYCTLAASSAKDSTEGFLGPRSDGQGRQYVKIPNSSDSPLYVCEAIDDFHHDVEEGILNQRGWVLQERALSRRTIHFTATQTYWECGLGVRCETLTLMKK